VGHQPKHPLSKRSFHDHSRYDRLSEILLILTIVVKCLAQIILGLQHCQGIVFDAGLSNIVNPIALGIQWNLVLTSSKLSILVNSFKYCGRYSLTVPLNEIGSVFLLYFEHLHVVS